ncbi:MAG: hypothetical protein L0Y67_03190 [Gammaproteobacteria bacterium]|nr:hypothetical protein [Gammaproteobacteria bacterium]
MALLKFIFETVTSLPSLAWCAEIRRDSDSVHVGHGPAVETISDCFVEGAWGGDFQALDFSSALTFTGTGGLLARDGVLFTTPTHTLQAIYSMRFLERILCSNSLAFILAQANDEVDLCYKYYDSDLMSIRHGLDYYVRRIPTSERRWIDIHYHCNIQISQDLRLTRLKKATPSPFSNYTDYHSFLEQEVELVTRNAGCDKRRNTYTPLTTISTGYDSPACAVLARAAGCREAVTFTRARSDFPDTADSGSRIAALLGLSVEEYDPEEYRQIKGNPEVEFVATGLGAEDIVFAALERKLPGRLIYTGYGGGKIWARVNSQVGHTFVRSDPSGGSLHEFRLRLGFINFPIAFIGGTQHSSIHTISNSKEMVPWSLGNAYDKPIPRRIVEDAGIPRSLFGQSKKAVSRPYLRSRAANPALNQWLSQESLVSFESFMGGVQVFSSRFEKAYLYLLRRLCVFNLRVSDSVKLSFALRRLGLPAVHPFIPEKYVKEPGPHMLLFHWAIARLKRRYAGYSV